MHAKKSLGQHWLISESARAKIVAAANLAAGETVLEIGPGRGFLTEALLATGAKVVAVEKDDALVPLLQTKFASQIATGQLTLFHQDILAFRILDFEFRAYKLVANIPYYLTGQIFRKFLGAAHQPTSMTVLVQKEVAERIVARDKKESLLSISVKAYGEPKIIAPVPAGSFSPSPKVASAILHIANISRARLAGVDEQKFFALLKRGFSSKRKMLGKKFGSTSLTTGRDTRRAEDLTLKDWQELYYNGQ